MPNLSNVTFNRTNGIGALAEGNDYISGLLFYSDASLPTGFDTDDRVKKVFNLQGAEDLGIVDTYSDETKSTAATVQITGVGSEDDVETIKIDGVLLGSYTVQNGDDANAEATGLAAAINALSNDHGFTAEASTDTVTITQPDGLGQEAENATIAFASSGDGTGSVTQFADGSGTGSEFKIWHYHIKEFFRRKPDGVLYIGIYAVPDSFDGSEIQTMQNAADGEIRQIGVYYPEASFASSQVTAMQTYLESLRAAHKQCFGVLHADCSSLTLANLPDLSALTASKVSVDIAEDGNWHQSDYAADKTYNPGDKFVWLNHTYVCGKSGTGKAPYNTEYFSEISEVLTKEVEHSVGTIGALLGTIAAADVHENIGYVAKFNIASGNILDTLGFATGVTYKAQAASLLNTLNTYHYTFLRKFERNSGSYYNFSYTAIAQEDSDYYTIENNRVMDKAERLSYDAMVPLINSELNLKSDGTLTQATIDKFEAALNSAIEAMANNISVDDDGNAQYSATVPPSQNVLQTGKVSVTLALIPKGVAREIVVNNSFVVSL